MFTVSDIIHLIQYYYHTTSYEGAAADVDTFRLESIRGECSRRYLDQLVDVHHTTGDRRSLTRFASPPSSYAS